MFKFDLPKNAVLRVDLPTGGTAIMAHVGGGQFVSNIPPLALAGISAVAGEEVSGLPLVWDSSLLPADAHHAVFGFDTAMAEKSLEDAAAAGDARAKAVLDQVIEAEKQLQAQIAVGMVPAAAAPAEAPAAAVEGDDFALPAKACDLSGEGTCEACQ